MKAVPLLCVLAKLTANLLKLAGLTVTDKRSEPAASMLPSVTATTAVSTLNNSKLAVATPLLKLMLVVVPNAVLSTFAEVTGLLDAFAPEKLKFLAPLYPVTVFPLASLAVIVML